MWRRGRKMALRPGRSRCTFMFDQMSSFLKKIFLLGLVWLLCGLGLHAQTLTVTPSTSTLSAAGGTITFTISLSYPGTLSSLGFQIGNVPAGWSFGAASGTSVPQVAPAAASTANFEFAYTTVPASPATFAFTVNYPAGLAGNQTFSNIVGIFRPTGGVAQQVSAPDITFPTTSSPTAPSIIAHPVSQTVTAGTNVTLSVSAAGSALSYQWRKDGVALVGATASSLALSNIQLSAAGSYAVVVSNSAGQIASNAATVTVVAAAVAPTITAQPAAQIVAAGSSATFRVTATGTGLSYQWRKDGAAIAGATSDTLVLTNVQTAATGAYSVVVSNTLGSVTSQAAALTLATAVASSRVINISVRSVAGSGDQTLIVGFAIAGSGAKQVLLRGVGPGLAQFGIVGALADPQLRLFNEAAVQTNFNDDWGGGGTLSAAFVQVGAFGLSPSTSKDAAMLVPIPAGAHSAHVVAPAGSGVAILEAYDADGATSATRFTNLSARSQVGVGENILVAGFVVDGTAPKRLLLRGAGPALAQFGLSGLLARPQITLYREGSIVAENAGWSSAINASAIATAAVEVGAFAFGANSLDAAMLVELHPGGYTLQVSGVGGAAGVALVEVYERP